MIDSFTHLLRNYLLYTYSLLGTRNTELNKTNKGPCPHGAESVRQDINKNPRHFQRVESTVKNMDKVA